MNEFDPIWIDRKHVVSSSLCAPSIRTVVLALYHHPNHKDNEEEFDTEIFPVIAIESRIVEVYTKKVTQEKDYIVNDLPRNVLKQLGFRIRSRDIQIRPIYARSEEGGELISIDDHSENTQIETVVCTWPSEQDADKFKPIFENMKGAARLIASVRGKAEQK